jgi:iron(III) transport system ATP-binding protein
LAEYVIHGDASPRKAAMAQKAFHGESFVYTLRLASGCSVLALVPSHLKPMTSERIGIRLSAAHI